MRVVTTVHKAGFERYGFRWVESIKNWPKAEFVMYAEGFDPDGVHFKRCEDVPRLVAFKEKHKHYKPVSWHWDVVRFCNKVYAAYDALYDYKGLGVWLDADTVTYNPIPEGYIGNLLPPNCYIGHFRRTGHYTETGMWLIDCGHPQHKAFLDRWLEWFESGAFKTLREWHDCTTLDATIRQFEKAGLIKSHSLSGEFEREMHPMAKVDLAKYLDHCKGPRKDIGASPENTFRKVA